MSKIKSLSVGKSMSATLLNLPLRHHYVMRRTSSASSPSTGFLTSASGTKSFRIVVLGVGGVGKTALTVRFMTNRYIGDYEPSLETIYCHWCQVDDNLVEFQVMDTAAGQDDESLLLEDKCKWGESFIFVYDVTDKYSFDELTRLKFIASYIHSRMKNSFQPCWALVGNKRDLEEHERMVGQEEGQKLAAELGCHIFREISVKESMYDARDLYIDLWREFAKRTPRISSRRKPSVKLHDKIPIVRSQSYISCIQRPINESSRSSEEASSTKSISRGRRNAISLVCDSNKNTSSYLSKSPPAVTSSIGTSSDFCRARSVGDMRPVVRRR